MKKCPKCKAEIQDEARFCLYCMTSFEEKQPIEIKKEKNKRWLYIIAAVLVFAIIISSIIIFAPKDSDSKEKNNTANNTFISSNSDTSDDSNNTTPNEQEKNPSNSNKTSTPSDNSNNDNDTGNDDNTNDKPNNNTTDDTPNDNTGDDTENDDTTDTPTNTQPKFTYVTATIANAYPTGYSATYAPENAIVITKVNYKETSGNYVIPDTIDGKTVAAIMPSAFSDSQISSSVKSVTLPSSVKTIWNDAFKNCYNLTHLYLKSAVIAIYEDAFPSSSKRIGKLTIHCKKDCRNFDYYYYRNIASRYDADYVEWNG